jgi:hypothetical protein
MRFNIETTAGQWFFAQPVRARQSSVLDFA